MVESDASKIILQWRSMLRWFSSSPLAPPSSKSAEVFLKRGSTAKSKSNFFSEIVEKSLTRLASALCVYRFSLVSIITARCLPFDELSFPFVSLHPRFRLSCDQHLIFSIYRHLRALSARPLNSLPVSVATESTREV